MKNSLPVDKWGYIHTSIDENDVNLVHIYIVKRYLVPLLIHRDRDGPHSTPKKNQKQISREPKLKSKTKRKHTYQRI